MFILRLCANPQCGHLEDRHRPQFETRPSPAQGQKLDVEASPISVLVGECTVAGCTCKEYQI